MKRILFLLFLFVTAVISVMPLNLYAEEGKPLDTKGLADEIGLFLELRPRYEHVDSKNATKKPADALTLRTRVGLNFKGLFSIDGLKTYIEATNVSHFGLINDYNSTSAKGGNNRTQYDTVIDPPITRFTQAYISYDYKLATFGFGRRRLVLDNARFVGDVGWRQMLQTFGVADITAKYMDGRFYIAYVFERNGIKDELSTDTIDKGRKSLLFHASYKFAPPLNVTAYAYLLNTLHDTYGVRLTGKYTQSDVKLDYVLETATQQDATLEDDSFKTSASDGNADSYFFDGEIGAKYRGIIVRGGYEVFGDANGDATTGFATPWATLHKFEGWADALLGKAANGDAKGFTDLNGTIGYADPKIGKILLVYHKFESKEGSLDYGDEIDLLFARKFKGIKYVAKAAFYNNGDDFGTDTTKFWLMAVYRF